MKAHKRNLSTSSITPSLADHDTPASPRYTYSRQHRPWSTILLPYRVGLRLLTGCLALAIGGLLAYLVIVRDSTKDSRYLDASGKNQMAWPRTIHMEPTVVLLIAAGVSFLFDAVSLVMSCAEAQRGGSVTVWLGPLAFISCIAVWVVGLVYAKSWTNSDAASSDLWSWSCRHRGIDLNYGNESLGFGTLCQYMGFVFGGGVAAATLQLINLVLFWVVQKSKSDEKKIAARNAYVRKYILGKVEADN